MFTNLKQAMYRETISMEAVADAIGVHRNTLALKISGSSPFLLDEVITIQEKFFPAYSWQWLFKKFNSA